jgi:predicted TPR repeat methyltransferase
MDYWKNFWNQQDSPLHESMTEESYTLYAKELLLILESIDKTNFNTVLEIGCGDGSFYEHMGFKKTTYKGFDISESLIKLFKKKKQMMK